jgi:hypothetical protein
MLGPSYGQTKPDHRYPSQFYFEDSIHVFWDQYPNPFSPPGIRDTDKGLVCGDLPFYCDLSDTVTVAFLGEKDSIVYEASIQSRKPPSFSFCYWLAGPRIDPQHLPAQYIRGRSGENFKLLLIVQGRKKCLRESRICIPKDWYCWIDESRYKE